MNRWTVIHAEKQAKETLLNARDALERALNELDHYIQRLDEHDTPLAKADVMNWALNYLAGSITPNLRLDLIANAQAALARVHAQELTTKKGEAS